MAPDQAGRADRGFPRGGEQAFTTEQRIYLLERDFDAAEKITSEYRKHLEVQLDALRKELREGQSAIRRTVTTRLNVLVAVGFSLLLSIVAVLVTVIANHGP